MKITKILAGISIIGSTLISCNNKNDIADGYGNFEATETTISAESTGKLISFTIEEGNLLKNREQIVNKRERKFNNNLKLLTMLNSRP